MKTYFTVIALAALPIVFASSGDASAATKSISFSNRIHVKSVKAADYSKVRIGSASLVQSGMNGNIRITSSATAGRVKANSASIVTVSSVYTERSSVDGNLDLRLTSQVGDIRADRDAQIQVASFEMTSSPASTTDAYGSSHGYGAAHPYSGNAASAGYQIGSSQSSGGWRSESSGPVLYGSIENTPIRDGMKRTIGGTLYTKSYEKTYGYNNDYVKVGNVHAGFKAGTLEYDPDEQTFSASPIELGAGVSLVEADYEASLFDGVVGGSVHGEAGSAYFTVNPVEFNLGPDGGGIKGEVGAGIYAGKVEAQGQVALTPVSIYDTLVRKPVSFAGDQVSDLFADLDNCFKVDHLADYIDDYTELPALPDDFDHGLVLRVGGEAGYGAVAQASYGVEASSEFTGIYAEADLGLGGALGGDVGLGFK